MTQYVTRVQYNVTLDVQQGTFAHVQRAEFEAELVYAAMKCAEAGDLKGVLYFGYYKDEDGQRGMVVADDADEVPIVVGLVEYEAEEANWAYVRTQYKAVDFNPYDAFGVQLY